MFRHLLKRYLVCQLLTLLFSWNAAGESPETEAPQLPKLPAPARQALGHAHQGDVFLKADFQQLRGLPEIEAFAREMRDAGSRVLPSFAEQPQTAFHAASCYSLWR